MILFRSSTPFYVENMQINRNKILEIILLREYEYNKRCLPVKSSQEAIGQVWLYVYIYIYTHEMNIDLTAAQGPCFQIDSSCVLSVLLTRKRRERQPIHVTLSGQIISQVQMYKGILLHVHILKLMAILYKKNMPTVQLDIAIVRHCMLSTKC